jgi:hypothetical protein
MKFLKHLIEQPFIAATGFAALIHSTWALGSFFGLEPERWTIEWFGWLLPALLIAFSLDVGQISTSMKIRENGLNFSNGLAFVMIALSTYYLQFLHLALHLPSWQIGAGISEIHRAHVETMIGLAIWLLPALLPLSTLLYTFSRDKEEQPIQQPLPEPTITLAKPEQPLIEQKVTEIESSVILTEEIIQEPKYQAYCEDCGWSVEYPNQKKAERALRTHQNLHCSKGVHFERFFEAEENGHVD